MQTLAYDKHFTPQEANRMLPLVRSIVADIQQQGFALQEMQKTKPEAGSDEAEELKRAKEHRMKVINSMFQELEELGCFYKGIDFEIGMVDFPGFINEEEVLLCWKSDEAQITWYHPLDTGFKGRQLIPSDLLNAEAPAS